MKIMQTLAVNPNNKNNYAGNQKFGCGYCREVEMLLGKHGCNNLNDIGTYIKTVTKNDSYQVGHPLAVKSLLETLQNGEKEVSKGFQDAVARVKQGYILVA